MSWINQVLEQHKEFESPLNFWFWSGLTAISAVVKDNIWVDRHLFLLYPNIYVILYADSGLKKGPPINLAKKLVKDVNNTRVISGRSSIQGIIAALGSGKTSENQPINTKATGFICASELASALVEDKAALDILTDLYDRSFNEGDYGSLLKSEQFSLKDATVSLLGGINDAHADHMFSNKDIKGGFLGRTFVIHESKRNSVNSLIRKPTIVPDYKELGKQLKLFSELRGPFQDLDNTPAGKYYDEWYHEFADKVERQDIKDTTGTINRFSESVMKVAMLLAISDGSFPVITLHAMETAIVRSEQLIGNIRKTTMGTGKSSFAQEKAILINELINRDNHTITQQQLNKKYYLRANADEWLKIAASLETAGVLKVEMMGNVVCYRMPDKIVEEYKNHLKGK